MRDYERAIIGSNTFHKGTMDLNNSDKHTTNIDLLDKENVAGTTQGAGAALQDSIAATSAFNLTDRLPIFTYLVNSNRIRWYRVIMRVFLQRHRELYRYQLTAQEVRDAVRSILDPD